MLFARPRVGFGKSHRNALMLEDVVISTQAAVEQMRQPRTESSATPGLALQVPLTGSSLIGTVIPRP